VLLLGECVSEREAAAVVHAAAFRQFLIYIAAAFVGYLLYYFLNSTLFRFDSSFWLDSTLINYL